MASYWVHRSQEARTTMQKARKATYRQWQLIALAMLGFGVYCLVRAFRALLLGVPLLNSWGQWQYGPNLIGAGLTALLFAAGSFTCVWFFLDEIKSDKRQVSGTDYPDRIVR